MTATFEIISINLKIYAKIFEISVDPSKISTEGFDIFGQTVEILADIEKAKCVLLPLILDNKTKKTGCWLNILVKVSKH